VAVLTIFFFSWRFAGQKLNTDNLIASISEFPAARAKMKKTVLVIR